MGDIDQDQQGYMVNGAGRHRHTIKQKRRGKPRPGDRADCECGVEFVWAGGRFPTWTPTESAPAVVAVVRRGYTAGPRMQ